MRVRPLSPLLVVASALLVVPWLHAGDPASTGVALDPGVAFEKLKGLAGTWQGKAGHGDAAQPATVTWRVASGGSVVQETLFPDTPHEMISMYHLAAGHLVMTHYCSMGNQPRMRLDPAASAADRLVFVFDGGTGLDPAKDVHVHAGTLAPGGDTLRADWVVWKDGKEVGHNLFELQRGR